MKTRIALSLALVLCIFAFAGCGNASQTPAAAQAPAGKLIVGLDDTFAPMGFRSEAGELIGFDIDLANAVGEVMNYEIVFQPIAWEAKEMELEANNIDCVWNGMSRTPERVESMTLSKEYLNNRLVIMTNPGVTVASWDDLKQLNVGTQAGSSALEAVMAHEIYPDIKDRLSEYPTYDECILDMQAGRIDAMVVDEVLGQYKNNNLGTAFGIADVNFGDDMYVIGFRKGDTELCGKVEAALQVLYENGKGSEISKKWFGKELLLPMK